MFEAFLKQWGVLLSGRLPKDFDKFQKRPAAPEPAPEAEKQAKSDDSSKPPTSGSSKPPSDANKPPDFFGFEFGFGSNPSGKGGNQGKGTPIGGDQNPDQSKMLLFGALGFVAFISALTFFEMGYKEISWKDFVNK